MPDAGSVQSTHPLIKKQLESSIPIESLLGITVRDIREGQAIGSLQVGAHLANPMGTLQGGALCSLVDATMGMAFASTLQPEESLTTLDLQIHFFRPVWQAQLRAEARVIQRSKNFGYLECEVTDENGKCIAKASSKCFIVRGERALGR
jgi:uncharacterized protein (TIGR00369 family)